MSICPKNKSSKGRRDKRRANWKMTARPVQAQYEQVMFRYDGCNIFPEAPGLHHPQRIRIERLHQFMDGRTYSIQIFRGIHRRLAFMERIGSIESVSSI